MIYENDICAHEQKKLGVFSTECSISGPCKHYVELIEEKAKNHKLQRKTELLQARIDELMQRVQMLEMAMSQNGLSLDDVCVKIEVEDEHTE